MECWDVGKKFCENYCKTCKTLNLRINQAIDTLPYNFKIDFPGFFWIFHSFCLFLYEIFQKSFLSFSINIMKTLKSFGNTSKSLIGSVKMIEARGRFHLNVPNAEFLLKLFTLNLQNIVGSS